MIERGTAIMYPVDNPEQSGVTQKAPEPKRGGGFNREPFTKRMDDADILASKERIKIQEANRLAEVDYQRYQTVLRAYREPGNPTGTSVTDLAHVTDMLWRHLETAPVDLARKAQLKAELEPIRKYLREEPLAERIKRERAQEEEIRPVYIRARSLIEHEGRLAKLRESAVSGSRMLFFPFKIKEIQDYTDAIKSYTETPPITGGSRAARYMDEEIRKIAKQLPEGSQEEKLHQHLFSQTDATLVKLQQVIQTGDSHQIQECQHLWDHVLKIEMRSYDTKKMQRERRGLAFLLRYLARNHFAYSLYKKLVAAEASPYRDVEIPSVEAELATLRPGERMVIARLAQYQRDIVSPRQYALYEQHNAYDLLRQTRDVGKQQELQDTQIRTATTLATEALYDPDRSERSLEEVEREIAAIQRHWKDENRTGRVFRLGTFVEIKPFWESLEAQHAHALRLLEEVGRHLSDEDARGIQNRTILEQTLEQMQAIELQYLETLLRGTNQTLVRLEHELFMLTHFKVQDGKIEGFEQGIADELHAIQEFFVTLRDTFPSAASLGPYQATYEIYTNFCTRFEEVSGASSPQATYRPPRFEVSSDDLIPADRGRE